MFSRERPRAPALAALPAHRQALPEPVVAAAQSTRPLQRGVCPCGGGCPKCAQGAEVSGLLDVAGTLAENRASAMPAMWIVEDRQDMELEATIGAASLLAGAPANEGATPLPEHGESKEQRRGAAALRAELTEGGRALPGAVRQRLGAHFRQDFSHVRIHEGSSAVRANRQLDAEAFAFGEHIWLGEGKSANDMPLMAHELVHVMQQQPRAATARDGEKWRIQRLRTGDGELHIVEIVAFENSLRNAQTKLSDGDVQPIRLTKNDLAAGDYKFELPPGGAGEYIVTGMGMGTGTGTGKLYWQPRSVIEGKYKPSKHVTVRVLSGGPLNLYEKRRELNAINENKGAVSYSHYLTRKHAKSGTYADLKAMLDAQATLQSAGVSEDEMLLWQKEREDAQMTGTAPATEVDISVWATDFVAQREGKLNTELQSAVANRQGLTEQMANIESTGRGDPQFALVVSILNAGNRHETWDGLKKYLKRHGADLDLFFAAFEFEMRMATKALLVNGRVALIRMERDFFAGKNVGAEDRRLAHAIQMMNDARWVRNAAATKATAARKRDLADVTRGKYGNANQTEALQKDLKDADEALAEQKQTSTLGMAQERGLELHAGDRKALVLSKAKLLDFIYRTRQTLKRGEALVQGKAETLYTADKIVALTKQLVGVRKNSLVEALIDFHASIVTQEPLWREVLNVVSLLAMLVPGPAGLVLRAGLGLANVNLAMDDYANQSTLHEAGFASAAPGKLGLILTAGGAVLDLGSVVGAVAKGSGQIGNLGRLLRGGERTAEETLTASSQTARSTANEAKGASQAAEDAASAETRAGRTTAREGEDVSKQMADDLPRHDTGPDPRGERVGEGHEIRGAGDDVAADAIVPIMPRTPARASLQTRAALAKRRAELSASEATLEAERRGIAKELATRRSSMGSSEKVIELAEEAKSPGAALKANADAAKKRLLKLEKDATKLEDKLSQTEGALARVRQEAREVEQSIDVAHNLGKVRIEPQPVKLRTAKGVEVESWSKEYLLGTERAAFRRDVEKILLSEPNGPLSKALLKAGKKFHSANMPKGSTLKDFLDRPEVWQAAHVVTRGNGEEVLVVSSLFRNQRMGAELERTGVVATERAFIIQGIAVDTATAYSLVEQKLLDAAVLHGSDVRLIQLMD